MMVMWGLIAGCVIAAIYAAITYPSDDRRRRDTYTAHRADITRRAPYDWGDRGTAA